MNTDHMRFGLAYSIKAQDAGIAETLALSLTQLLVGIRTTGFGFGFSFAIGSGDCHRETRDKQERRQETTDREPSNQTFAYQTHWPRLLPQPEWEPPQEPDFSAAFLSAHASPSI